MSNYVPISLNTHSEKSWTHPTGFHIAPETAVIAIGASEVAKLCTSLPLAFVSGNETSRLMLVVGLEPGQNLMLGQRGNWLNSYIPAELRLYPFCLVPTQTSELALAIDEGRGLVNKNGVGETFFSPDGALNPLVKSALEQLTILEREKNILQELSSQIGNLKLLTPWEVNVKYQNGVRQVQGLQRIDETRLNSLSNDDFLSLRSTGALSIAYCQMISTQNMAALIQRAEAWRPIAAAVPTMELDFSRFGR